MNQNTQPLTENSIIDWSSSMINYREFLTKIMGLKLTSGYDFYFWLNRQTGKTLKEAIKTYGEEPEQKNMNEILLEERFNAISEVDKTFIVAFDKEIGKLGYDFGGSIGKGDYNGKFMITYYKTGVKSQKVVARIFIRDNEIILKLILTDVKKHSSYIENAAAQIKDVFVGKHGDCDCNPKNENCRMIKTYTIDGKQMEKCSERVFEFWKPNVDILPDYIRLLTEFYPVKKSK